MSKRSEVFEKLGSRSGRTFPVIRDRKPKPSILKQKATYLLNWKQLKCRGVSGTAGSRSSDLAVAAACLSKPLLSFFLASRSEGHRGGSPKMGSD